MDCEFFLLQVAYPALKTVLIDPGKRAIPDLVTSLRLSFDQDTAIAPDGHAFDVSAEAVSLCRARSGQSQGITVQVRLRRPFGRWRSVFEDVDILAVTKGENVQDR
jgi:hypothetical protein